MLQKAPLAQVFARERLNGYYGVASFAFANTLSSVPFIFAITVISTLCVYYLAALNTASDRVIYFILDLFLSLLVVRPLLHSASPGVEMLGHVASQRSQP